MFLIYINDVAEAVGAPLFLYADDAVIQHTQPFLPYPPSYSTLLCLRKRPKIFMYINFKKTKSMLLNWIKSITSLLKMTCTDGSDLEFVCHYKYFVLPKMKYPGQREAMDDMKGQAKTN